MKYKIRVVFTRAIGMLVVFGSLSLHAGARWTINKIITRVNGVNILSSDIELPRIAKEGGKFTLDEAISEELWLQQAAEQHMLPTDVEVERQIVAFKMQNNMGEASEEEFEKQLKQMGLNLKQCRQQFARLIALEKIKHTEIADKIVVTSQEVEEYYKKHPVYSPEAYHLKISTDKTWEDLGWINRKDLDKQFMFVISCNPGDIQKVTKDDKEHEVKLVEKRKETLKSLKERYITIEKKLYEFKRQQLLTSSEKSLQEKASIIRL